MPYVIKMSGRQKPKGDTNKYHADTMLKVSLEFILPCRRFSESEETATGREPARGVLFPRRLDGSTW